MEYNVLLLGGYLCGKTSVLASMYDEVKGKLSSYFSIRDITHGYENDQHNALTGKLMEMKRFASNKNGNNGMFCMNYGPSISYNDTTLRFSKSGKTKGIDFLFTDVPGSICQGMHYDRIQDRVRKAETCVVVIDTPYLMVGNVVENVSRNISDIIFNLLTSIEYEKEIKQVLFVPVKCERWIQNGEGEKVVQKVEEEYSQIIDFLKKNNKVEIGIIPVQTIGNIIFSELSEAYILSKNEIMHGQLCSKVTDNIVILRDGRCHRIQDDELLIPDPSFCSDRIEGAIRMEWFQYANNRNAGFSPENCDQLFLHILRFMLKKFLVEGKNHILPLPKEVNKDTAREILVTLMSNKLIKDDTDCIHTIKSVFIN